MSKVAVSLPDELFAAVERSRRHRGLSRSAAVQEALRRWAAVEETARAARAYVEGYRRAPEDPLELDAWEQAEAWGEWNDEPPAEGEDHASRRDLVGRASRAGRSKARGSRLARRGVRRA